MNIEIVMDDFFFNYRDLAKWITNESVDDAISVRVLCVFFFFDLWACVQEVMEFTDMSHSAICSILVFVEKNVKNVDGKD